MKRFLLTIISLLCFAGTALAAWTNASFSFEGHVRNYRIYTPVNYDPAHPATLIVVLHGLGGTMYDASAMGITGIADTANIILLSPQALDYTSPLGLVPAAWNSGISITIPGMGTYPVNPDIDDVAFIQAMMDSTIAGYSVNNDRVYVCGASMGGFMTQRLACEAADRFAAVASVMGTYALALPDCNPGKILPVAHFHGTDDEVVSWNGELLYGSTSFPVGLSVDQLIQKWVTIDNCNPVPQHDTWPNSNNDNLYVEHYTYFDNDQHSKVELFKVNGGAHTWYQDNNTGGEIDYATEIWKFFNKQYYGGTTSLPGVTKSAPEAGIYPNPVTDKFFLKNSTAFTSAQVTDISGKALITTDHLNAGIDITGLTPGIYFIKLHTAKDGIVSAKFVKK